MPTDYTMRDMLAHGYAAVRKAQEIRDQQVAYNTKLAEAAPAIVDALIANRFIAPDDRDLTIAKMQKQSFVLNLFHDVANKATHKAASSPYDLGTPERSSRTKTSGTTSLNPGEYSDAANAAWESMLY